METRPPRPAQIALIVAFALSCFIVGLIVWRTFGGSVPLEPKGYRVHVLFGAEGTQLTQGSQVRIAGIPVGTVTSTHTRGSHVDATLQLQSRYAPMPADTRAIVRYKTLLGESFVALTPGTRDGPKLPEGATLPLSQVHPKQTIDEVLGTFDAPTRRALRSFLTDLHAALRDRGGDLNDALGAAPSSVEALDRLATVLDAEGPALRSLIRDGGTALNAFGARADAVQRLVRAGDQVLGATGSQQRRLREAIGVLPGFLRGLRATLRAADAAGADARPALHELTPVAPLVRPALVRTAALAPALRTTFRRLDPIMRASARTLPALGRTVRLADALMRRLDPAGRDLVPVLELIAAYRREIVGSLANAASATDGKLNGHHALRILLTANDQAPFGQTTQTGTWRSNPYPAPGATLGLSHGLGAFTCASAGHAGLTPAPPCVTQPPWTFRGETRSYPRLTPGF